MKPTESTQMFFVVVVVQRWFFKIKIYYYVKTNYAIFYIIIIINWITKITFGLNIRKAEDYHFNGFWFWSPGQSGSSICWYTTKQEAIHLWERQASSGIL